jgi:hypothetical protein
MPAYDYKYTDRDVRENLAYRRRHPSHTGIDEQINERNSHGKPQLRQRKRRVRRWSGYADGQPDPILHADSCVHRR